jgi:flagellar biosynthesis/type III secretory pathway chaperone
MDAFAALVEEAELESRHLAQIGALLDEERAALTAGLAARLEEIVAEKINQVQALELCARRRDERLRALGFAPGQRGLMACQAAHPQGARLRALWNRIAEQAAAARDGNALNGRLIEARLQQVQARLAQLASTAGEAVGYGADGRAHARPPSRALGRV